MAATQFLPPKIDWRIQRQPSRSKEIILLKYQNLGFVVSMLYFYNYNNENRKSTWGSEV